MQLRLVGAWAAAALTGWMMGCSCAGRPSRSDAGVVDASGTSDVPGPLPDVGDAGSVPTCRIDRGTDFRTPRVGDCYGRIAERTFRRAVCSCTEVSLNTSRIEAFDSRLGPPATSTVAGGASVGANGSVGGSSAYFGGTITAAHDVNGASSQVFGDVESDGNVGTNLTVSRDTYAGGASVSSLTIGRDLIHSPSTSVSSTTVAGETRICDVQVEPPCPCDPALLIDVAAFVADGASSNDNARLGFDPTVLDGVSSETVDIPPGRIYAPSIFLSSGGVIRVSGDTALFVGDDFLIAAGTTARLEVAADAHLDVFVGGDFTINGVNTFFGNEAHPANVRLYGAAGVTDNGVDNVVAASIYAPASAFILNGEGSVVYGSVFAQNVILNGGVSIVYDLAITEASGGCPDEPPATCTACAGCDGAQACVGGTCGDCRTDADCCSPLVCNEGRCEPLLF